LSGEWLSKLLTCLEVGPLALIERQHLPTALEMLAIPDSCGYQPARPGVKIPSHLQQQSQQHWEAEKLLQLFVPSKSASREGLTDTPLALPPFEPLPQPPIFLPGKAVEQPSQAKTVSEILAELNKKPIGIQAVALISGEGKLLSSPLGMEESRAEILAGLLLYFGQNLQDELQWLAVDNITIRAGEGHLILTRCKESTFLLVMAGKSLIGLLEGEINRTVKQLQPLVV
jgi:predicted regulator of Ras-like GTPase activity (Roadblock/LC7/MglB family)